MKGDVKAPRGKDSRDLVSKLTLTANPENVVDQLKLAFLAHALFPLSKEDRDKQFDDWIKWRITEYCQRNNVRIEVVEPNEARDEQ